MFRSGMLSHLVFFSLAAGVVWADEPPVNIPALRIRDFSKQDSGRPTTSGMAEANSQGAPKTGRLPTEKKPAAGQQKAGPAGKQPNSRWTVLLDPTRRLPGTRPLTPQGKLQSPKELELTGHNPGDPFELGDFAADGQFGLVHGGLEKISGQNAVLQLPDTNQFELEGVMEQTGFGGWFLVVGWGQERGYLLSNVTLKQSGSRWYLSEMRGAAAIPEGTEQLQDLEWLRVQPFRLSVEQNVLTFEVGKKKVVDGIALENYAAGSILFGVYDTRYGPKKLRIHSLRIRELPDVETTEPPVDARIDGDMGRR